MKMSKAASASSEGRMNRTHTLQNKEELKHKVFDERKVLVGKWFEKWSETQRVTVLEDLINHCKVHHLDQLNSIIACQKPVYRDDFTHVLPRFLSLRIFSFLDPRSLSRCAQVSWHWKYLAELDDLWQELCWRLSWKLTYDPSPFESGVWKQLYVNSIVLLKKTVPMTARTVGRDLGKASNQQPAKHRPDVPTTDQRPPWKGSDPTPRDTWRNNFLENDDTIGNNARPEGHRKAAGRAKMPVSAAQRANYSMTRSKSTQFMQELTDSDFPVWAQFNGGLVGGAPFMARPMTSDRGFGSTLAFDRTYSSALIDPAYNSGTIPANQTGFSIDKKFDLTIH